MLVIDYPSKKFLERAIEAVNNGRDVEIRVANQFRKKILAEYLPYLTKNKDQKNIWKTIFRWFYLVDFIALYGTILERDGYYVSYSTTDAEMRILFERRVSN